MSFPDAMRELFTKLERRISEDPASAGQLCSVLTRVAMLTPTELEKCMNLLKGDAAPAYTHFQWGLSARCVRIVGPRILADAGPAKVGAALSMEACADGAHSWTLRRISNGGSGISDYLGVCVGAVGICLSATPTSGSFNGFVVGFRVTANVGGDLRYKTSGSLLQKWQRRLPTQANLEIQAISS